MDKVQKFLEKFYKPDRYHGRGQEYAELLLNSYRKEYKKTGYILISRHDSVTGKVEELVET